MLASERVTQRYAFRPDVVATELEDGAVLLDLETKYFYRLNRTGWIIAQLFETGASLQDVHAYCQALGATSSEVGAITLLVKELLRDNLVEASSQPAGEPALREATSIPWSMPTIEKQAEPMQRVIISAFDPSVPLVE